MRTTRRTVAVVGAMVAVGATALMGIAAGTAAAETPGRCLENVNVRAEPSIDSRIVAVCEQGTAVETERVRDGFVQLTDLGGWAAAEYIEIDGRPAGAPGSAPRATTAPSSGGASPTTPGEDALPADDDAEPSDDTAGTDAPADDDEAEDETGTDAPAAPAPAPPLGGSPLAGLL